MWRAAVAWAEQAMQQQIPFGNDNKREGKSDAVLSQSDVTV
jgi:hypothetical protein